MPATYSDVPGPPRTPDSHPTTGGRTDRPTPAIDRNRDKSTMVRRFNGYPQGRATPGRWAACHQVRSPAYQKVVLRGAVSLAMAGFRRTVDRVRTSPHATRPNSALCAANPSRQRSLPLLPADKDWREAPGVKAASPVDTASRAPAQGACPYANICERSRASAPTHVQAESWPRNAPTPPSWPRRRNAARTEEAARHHALIARLDVLLGADRAARPDEQQTARHTATGRLRLPRRKSLRPTCYRRQIHHGRRRRRPC